MKTVTKITLLADGIAADTRDEFESVLVEQATQLASQHHSEHQARVSVAKAGLDEVARGEDVPAEDVFAAARSKVAELTT